MGTLFYGLEPVPIAMPDAMLAHLQAVISTKLRRGESFTMTWRHAQPESLRNTTIQGHDSRRRKPPPVGSASVLI